MAKESRWLEDAEPARYPCAIINCSSRAVRVEARTVRPNGMRPSVAFYGYCAEHVPLGGPDAITMQEFEKRGA